MKPDNNKKFLISTLLLLASVPFLCGTALAKHIFTDQELATLSYEEIDSINRADSIEEARLDSIVADVQNSFLHYQQLEKDDQTEPSVYYPILVETYNKNLKAFDQVGNSGIRFNTLKELLRNLNPELENACYYYSGKNDSKNMAIVSRAYIDTQLMPMFKDEKFFTNTTGYPAIIYVAARDAYNNKEYEKAIDYFKLFLATGSENMLETVYACMGQSCIETGNYELALKYMTPAIKIFPQNPHIARMGLKAASNGYAEQMQPFLDAALAINPDDATALLYQGKLYEDDHEYQKALVTFKHFDEVEPNTLNAAKHIGLCYFNLGVQEFDNAINAEKEKEATKARTRARNYFQAAIDKFDQVVLADPSNSKYLAALAACYLCNNDIQNFERTNSRLQAMGLNAISNTFVPSEITDQKNNTKNFTTHTLKETEIKPYDVFAKEYVEQGLIKFETKGEFETIAGYNARVNQNTITDKIVQLNKEAAQAYLDTYKNRIAVKNMEISQYDPENQNYRINTNLGPVVIHVPMKNDEAENFKTAFKSNNVTVRKPDYYIADNTIRIGKIYFEVNGKKYQYDKSRAGVYEEPPIINIDNTKIIEILNNTTGNTGTTGKPEPNGPNRTIGPSINSDVDQEIPVGKSQSPNTLAVIIANENYTNPTAPVASALHDGRTMRQYFEKTLGLPKTNIIYVENATKNGMDIAISKLEQRAQAHGGDINILFYYAGHGFPKEGSKEAYLLPVDGDVLYPNTAVPLEVLYKRLSDINSNGVVAFVDACFSGSQRGEGVLNEARSLSIAPKNTGAQGKMWVLSAATGEQTAMPYREKDHGLFTYFLLKKIQETKGNVSLGDLSDYVIKEVSTKSSGLVNKQQTPTLSTSGLPANEWRKKKL